MNARRAYNHDHHCDHLNQQQHTVRPIREDKCRVFENENHKHDILDKIRNEIVHANQQNCIPETTYKSVESLTQFSRNASQRPNNNLHNSLIMKDREIAKLKALIFEKDNEVIGLTLTNKNTIAQMEERMERERKAWNEHKDLIVAGERTKCEEEKLRFTKDLQDQLKHEQERCQRLEQKLHDAQVVSSETQLMLKDSDRERINAVYGTKEQCRKEFQDEIARIRNQFQSEKNAELARMQDRIRELEDALARASSDNDDTNIRQHELLLNLETSEKTCVRSIIDCIKKLLMAIDSPSHAFTKISQMTSFTYDRESVIERAPTRNALKLLQDTIDSMKNFIMDLKVQIETHTKVSNKSKLTAERKTNYSNRTYNDENDTIARTYCQRSTRNPLSKDHHPECDYRFHDIDRLSPHYCNDTYRLSSNSSNPFHLSSEQNDTINNLVQKLEDHIASELNRLTKQRLTLNGSNSNDERLTPHHIKLEFVSNGEAKQDILIRHLQDRINDLRHDNLCLREKLKSKSFSIINENSFQNDNDIHRSFSSMHLNNCPTAGSTDI